LIELDDDDSTAFSGGRVVSDWLVNVELSEDCSSSLLEINENASKFNKVTQ